MLAQNVELKVLVCIEWKYIEMYSGLACEGNSKTYNNQRNI